MEKKTASAFPCQKPNNNIHVVIVTGPSLWLVSHGCNVQCMFIYIYIYIYIIYNYTCIYSCIVLSGCIKGTPSATNQIKPDGFSFIPVVT